MANYDHQIRRSSTTPSGATKSFDSAVNDLESKLSGAKVSTDLKSETRVYEISYQLTGKGKKAEILKQSFAKTGNSWDEAREAAEQVAGEHMTLYDVSEYAVSQMFKLTKAQNEAITGPKPPTAGYGHLSRERISADLPDFLK